MHQLEALRRAFELPPEHGASKVMSLSDAVRRFVRPGMSLHLCWSDSRPNAAVAELVRQFAGARPGFEISSVGLANTQAALVAAGLVRKLVTAYAGESYPAGGVNAVFKRAIDAREVEIEHWSQWTFVQRLMAGALGLPFMPTRSLTGSSLPEGNPAYAEVASPFSGEPIGAVAPLAPDLAILQGLAADRFGNVVMSAPYGESHWGALAATGGVIACVERIVPTEVLRRCGAVVRIPGHCVRAVCHVPFGSHPYGSFTPPGELDAPSYVEDADFIAEAAAACRDPKAMQAWIAGWITDLPDHDAYRAKLGAARLSSLQSRAVPDGWAAELRLPIPHERGHTDEEAMIVTAARHIARLVRDGGYDTVLAGIGASNIASWLAERLLTAEAVDVALMSEIGIYGYAPRPGEPFVFSNRNIATARLLGDVSMTLGTLVGGAQARCLGALGAALIDGEGNIGTTYDQDGGFIVGSGGGNDIASSAAQVLVTVKHGKRRLVDRVRYVTSPGARVRVVVTSRAVLVRDSGEAPFRIVSVLASPNVPVADAVASAQADCGWPLGSAPDVTREPPPSAEELELIRAFDPDRIFLGALAPLQTSGAA